MGNLHLVTGYAGASHVTAADAASLNAAIVGSGDYVLNRGNKFAASIVTNNKITIADGDLLMQGRHIRLNEGSTVDLTIENGASGYYRNDLIVARYTMNSNSGVEDCNLVVIKGTAAESNPVDPEYTSGDIINDHVLQADMPLYRVPLDGLNVQTLVPLFTVITKSLDNDDSGKQESTEKLTTGTTLADGDYFPFYDVSVSGHRKVLWSRIVTMIRTALFGSINGVLKANGSGVLSALGVDATPTANSKNLVTSGGVKAALDKNADKSAHLWEYEGTDYCFDSQTISVPGSSNYNAFAVRWLLNDAGRQKTTVHIISSTDDVSTYVDDVDPEGSGYSIIRKRNFTVNRADETFTFDIGERACGTGYTEYVNILVPLSIYGFNIG